MRKRRRTQRLPDISEDEIEYELVEREPLLNQPRVNQPLIATPFDEPRAEATRIPVNSPLPTDNRQEREDED